MWERLCSPMTKGKNKKTSNVLSLFQEQQPQHPKLQVKLPVHFLKNYMKKKESFDFRNHRKTILNHTNSHPNDWKKSVVNVRVIIPFVTLMHNPLLQKDSLKE